MARKKFWLGLSAIILIIVVTVIACGDGGGNNIERDSRLILEDGYAWVDTYIVGLRDGYIFKANGTIEYIDDYSGSTPGEWVIYKTAAWSTSNDQSLTVSSNNASSTYPYTVTDTTLTLRGEVLTKTPVTIP